MKKYFLVGNAHLDPVWQWDWQEGSMEAKATIRSALDRMQEFPKYKFVCSSASVYKWVEEFAPEMFEEVKERVKEGRFIIVGGWFVQPDCNSPAGEGFARQTLYSQRYFLEKFGKTATVGYNVDSFGHNAMLPQILKKSGMNEYIFMRPGAHETDEIKSEVFNWVSPDGSSVLTYRIGVGCYCTNYKTKEDLEEHIAQHDELQLSGSDACPVFYGVGNHGGGPTIRNLELLKSYAESHPEKELIYSDISDFFDYIRSSKLDIPDHRNDLQHHASGCYSAVSSIKQGIRRSECELIAAESFSMLGSLLSERESPNDKFEEAWENICFLHFHDYLGGCSYKKAYEDAKYMVGFARNIAAKEENNALQSISWKIDTSNKEKGVPIVVFNPHGFSVEQTIRLNLFADRVVDNNGEEVPFQRVRSSTQECMKRNDTIFKARVPALGFAVYYVNTYPTWEIPYPEEDRIKIDLESADKSVFAIDFKAINSSNIIDGIILENEIYKVVFDRNNGNIIEFFDKEKNKSVITENAAVPLVIDEFYHDTWSHSKNYFDNVIGKFTDAKIKITECGPIRATVRVETRYNDSKLIQYFSLEKGSNKLQVRATVDWREKHKMLKIKWPMAVVSPRAFYEIPFGIIERPCNGEEEPGLMWTAVMGENGGYALINDDTYSSSVKEGTIYQTVVRSPIYGDHGGPRDDESYFTDQGERSFSYEIMPVDKSFTSVIKEAKAFNKPLSHIVETWHKGELSDKPYGALKISEENIVLSAIKRSEDGKGLILRLYETDGNKSNVEISGDMLRLPLKADFSPFSVNTYFLADDADVWREVLISEL